MNHILHRLEHCYQLAEQHFKRTFERPEVRLDLRGQKAGVAYLQGNLLRFNRQLYQENHAHFLQQTVPHEVAHLLAHTLYGPRIRPHGSEWQALMIGLFKLPAERCHHYQVPPRRSTQYLYRCACPEHMPFTAQRHALVRRGRRYACRRCGERLRFTGQQQIAQS